MTQHPWWRGAVIYQIYPRSFLDTNGDGIGDLPGIIRKLDYVAKLGVDAVWLSPFYPSPMRDFGYDITAHCDVHPDYGTMDDFEKLVGKAHDLGLKVIIDAVLNHTSIDHEWFEESRQSRDNPKADWYQWCDPKPDGSPPNNWISRFADSQWTWEPRREQYYRHQYMKEQPALNLANEEVVEQRLAFMRKWLDKGVDGMRFDAVTQYHADEHMRDNPPADPEDHDISPVGSYSTFAHQKHLYDCNDERIEGFLEKLVDQVRCAGCTYTYAELDVRYQAYENLARYTQEGMLDGAYTPDVMELALQPSEIARVFGEIDRNSCQGSHVWTLTNHDAKRMVSRWGGEEMSDEKRIALSKMAAALVCTLPGQISFFQGEELGLPNAPYGFDELKDPQGIRFWPKGGGRDPVRHPVPWSDGPGAGFTEGEAWLTLRDEVTACHAEREEPLATWRELICLRRKTSALRYGGLDVLEADDQKGLLGFARTLDSGERCEVWLATKEGAAELPETEGEELVRFSSGMGFGFRITAT
ncbi:alpha-amylase family glycosyl hydrolase [Parvularcula maris]|uniref:Alpha-amylase family glycosyl hydrolase n=1 Tax=Parvularcula maris TaxID=2965077 RepID=A0A9X2RL35_9PROT|nr:alpha-amylase family glycosyl hydrolase [Parvularcula maris]MCQ8186212.1 alpha-amylase family glycosyl hydrolase [Parvularcula maris]